MAQVTPKEITPDTRAWLAKALESQREQKANCLGRIRDLARRIAGEESTLGGLEKSIEDLETLVELTAGPIIVGDMIDTRTFNDQIGAAATALGKLKS